MRYPTTPPPGKLSDLIDLAVADARRLDRTTYTPNSSVWHEPADDGCCMICLAGSVIAGTLKCPRDKRVEVGNEDSNDPDRVRINDKEWQLALCALDDARYGCWERACKVLSTMNGPIPTDEIVRKLDRIPAPEHTGFHGWDDFDAHLESLTTCANDMRKLGL